MVERAQSCQLKLSSVCPKKLGEPCQAQLQRDQLNETLGESSNIVFITSKNGGNMILPRDIIVIHQCKYIPHGSKDLLEGSGTWRLLAVAS